MNGFAALDIPPCRRYVVVKATAGFAVCRLILKLLLFYSCLDFTQNLGKTQVFKACPSPDEIDACDSIESATALLLGYYEGAFKVEFTEYLDLIKEYPDDVFLISNS